MASPWCPVGQPNFQLRFLGTSVSSAFACSTSAVSASCASSPLAARSPPPRRRSVTRLPAVSQQLAALEREAGVALLEKNGRGRRLTPAGAELVQRTESILRELEAAEAALEGHHDPGRRRAPHGAAFASAHRVLLPQAIATLADPPPRPARHHAGRGTRGRPPGAQARRARPRARPGVRLRARPRPIRRSSARTWSRTSCASRCRRDHPLAEGGDRRHARSSTPSPGSPAARGRSATSWSSTRRAPPATSRGWPTSPTTSRVSYALVAGRRGGRTGAGAGRGLRRPAWWCRPIAGAPPSRRIYAAVRAGGGARPASRGDAGSAHRALSTDSSRPGKRASSSSRRSRFTRAVPSARCSITPLSRSTRK